MRGKKRWKAAAGFLLAAGLLAGCGREALPGKEEETDLQRGRYVQRETTLSEEWKSLTVKQVFSWEDKVRVLTAEQSGEVSRLKEWELQGEDFVDVTERWLADLELPCGIWAHMQLARGGDSAYVWAQLISGDGQGYQGRLWKGGEEAVEITPKEWATPDETWGGYPYIQGIAALEDGTLGALSMTDFSLINGEDGEILQSVPMAAGYGETFLGSGDAFYRLTQTDAGAVSGIEKWPGGKKEDAVQIPLPSASMTSFSLSAQEDGTLTAAGEEGIFRYNIVSEQWEKLLAGTETDFALTTRWCMGLAALSDGRIYALFGGEDGTARLLLYEYDPEAVSEVTQELTLYSVWENPLLTQAAVLYHREHPETLIHVECVYSRSDRYSQEAPDYNQVYQNLNTLLMGDEAPDILVMDHLDVESYAEKGLLADINDILEPLESSGQVLANITGAYVREDGSRFVTPLLFGFPMAVGRDIQASDMQSLESLAAFLDGRQESYLGPMTAGELVELFYPYFCDRIVKDGALDKEALKKSLEEIKAVADNGGVLESRPQDERQPNLWDLTSQTKLAIETVDGFWDCMTPLAMNEYIQGVFTCFENCFIPYLVTGVNARSEHLDTAKDFLGFALSQQAQDTEFYSGFPISSAALSSMAAADRADLAMETAIATEDGGMEIFQILPFSQETAQELVEICRNLERPAGEDAKIKEELTEALAGYLDGRSTLEQAVDAMEGGLKMYLAE